MKAKKYGNYDGVEVFRFLAFLVSLLSGNGFCFRWLITSLKDAGKVNGYRFQSAMDNLVLEKRY